jgi:putative hydrolase of the HAD superfamily
VKAILFDLDETIILDEPVSLEAFRTAAALAAPAGADPVRLARDAGAIAQRLWAAGPENEYCKRIGHSAWEGLWARYDSGDHPAIATLRAWVPGYRVRVWQEALAAHGVAVPAVAAPAGAEGPGDLAGAMAEAWFRARRRYPCYPEIDRLLNLLRMRGYSLGIVTNGVPDLQREKIAGCSVSHLFHAAVVSGEVDCGKPEPGIFRHICGELGVAPGECVMVGDNPGRDVAGARNAGMKAVWVQRGARLRDDRYPADLECRDLSALIPWLDHLEGA